jgi:O-antigen/teichoic acid export membrane protein
MGCPRATWTGQLTLELSDRAILQRFVSLAQLGQYSIAYQFGTLMNVLASAINNA